MKKNIYTYLVLILTIFPLGGCDVFNEPDEIKEEFEAAVTTFETSYLSNKVVCAEMEISYSGSSKSMATDRGILYSETPGVTIENGELSKKSYRNTTDEREEYEMSDLLPATKYYYRAYVTNGSVIFYGQEKSFTTTNATSATYSNKAYGETYNGFYLTVEIKNAYLAYEWGFDIYTDINNHSLRYTLNNNKAPKEGTNNMSFNYGTAYYKGNKVTNRFFIKQNSGKEDTSAWTYFIAP